MSMPAEKPPLAPRNVRKYAESIVETVREPLIVLDQRLRVISANRSFYETFRVKPEETEHQLIYELGNRQWDLPELRQLLEDILPKQAAFQDFEVEHDFPGIGRKAMLLNAREIVEERPGGRMILLAIEDTTERKRLRAELVVAKELSDALNDINAVIHSTLDFDRIMRRVIKESTKSIRCDTASLALREDDHWLVKYAYRLSRGLVGTRLTKRGMPHMALAARTKKPVVIDDAYADDRVNREVVRKNRIRSVLIVPLMVKGEVIGTLAFNRHSAPVAFTADQVDFAVKLAASVSLALENGRLYAEERSIADTLQKALLTVPEQIPGVDFGYLYRSATAEAAEVGGDFYDLFELGHNRLAIVIGDISGKGLEAATLTSLVKNIIKAYAYEESTPALVMAKTNDTVMKTFAPSMFATVFFGILNTRSGRLTYCAAGHPPALVIRKTGHVSTLDRASPVIGAFAGQEYVDDERTLAKADILFAYTDGVTEARRRTRFFGQERLISLAKKLKPASAKEVPPLIFEEVMDFTGGKLADDVALLAVALHSPAV